MERRLAAVLAADVAGYSRLMGADEEGTLARLKAVHIRALYPHLRSSHLRKLFYMRSSKHRAMVEEDIARLGLPE
jgi:class 3 adenylate cyclase